MLSFFNMQDAGHVQKKRCRSCTQKCGNVCKCVFFLTTLPFCERIRAVSKNICLGLICFPPINRGQYLGWAMQASVISILA